MNVSTPWPINKSGTSWRYAVVFFDWSDEQIVWDAIETVDPLKITARCKPVIVVGPADVEYMSMQNLLEIIQQDDQMFSIIDPGHDVQETCVQIGQEIGEAARCFVLGVGRLDLADQATHKALLGALEDRRERFAVEMPYIEFWLSGTASHF